jgi:uncharacterized protein
LNRIHAVAFDAIAIHNAYVAGDLAALMRALGDPPDFPNARGPDGVGTIPLEYAIYHSPLVFIRELLERGADPNYPDHAGFPSLIAAIDRDRPDRCAVLEMLLAAGADIAQRGINDWTPLHHAVARNDLDAITLLLAHGADPHARTRIDDRTTPLEDAEQHGREDAARLLRGR